MPLRAHLSAAAAYLLFALVWHIVFHSLCADATGGYVVVMGTWPGRNATVHAGGLTWRKHVHTVIVTEGDIEAEIAAPPGHNSSGLERWFTYPNDPTHVAGRRVSDTRCIASLRLANSSFPDAKWFLYGDDDTYWFVTSAHDLTRTLDPDVPYMLTDSNDCFGHCSYDDKIARCTLGEPYFIGNETCLRRIRAAPCWRANFSVGLCDDAYRPDVYNYGCGMAGVIFSRGALRLMNASTFVSECERRTDSLGGGDMRLGFCFSLHAGLGLTEPARRSGEAYNTCRFTGLTPGDIAGDPSRLKLMPVTMVVGDPGGVFSFFKLSNSTPHYKYHHDHADASG